MRKFAHFLLGLITATIYSIGIGSLGLFYCQHIINLNPGAETAVLGLAALLGLGMIALLPLLLVIFLYGPRFLKIGAIIPVLLAIVGAGYLITEKEVSPYFTDDTTYQSCIGNSDHSQGIADCTALIFKLENEGGIRLRQIENTKGDYWLAEILSYRGRHYIRNDQFKFGKEDFARAFLLPEGSAVVAGSLADAGFTRQDLFGKDFKHELSKLGQLMQREGITSIESGTDFLIAQFENTVAACQLATGREATNCRKLIQGKI